MKNKEQSEDNNDKKIKSADIIKGLIFVIIVFLLFYFSQLILILFTSLTSIFFHPLLIFLVILIVSLVVGILGFGARTGRPLWMLWKDNFGEKAKKNKSQKNGIRP